MSSVFCFRGFVTERLTAAAEDILCVFEKAVLEYEQEIQRQRRLLDDVMRPAGALHQRDITQLPVGHDEFLIENQLYVQESISDLGREDSDPPRIKEEPEEPEELRTSEGEQEADAFPSRPPRAVVDPTLLQDPLTNTSIPAIKSEPDREGSAASGPNGDLSRSVKVHARAHVGKKRHKCATCGKGFALKALARQHARFHAGAKPLGCPVCGKEFNCRSNHAAHMKTHASEKPHACITCGKRFSRGADLRRHHRTHTGEKPYSCVYCGKGFPYHSSLKNHIRVHTGEKPYKCALCGKGFAVGTTLKIHTRVHTGEKPYTCGVCGRTFAHGTGLRIHGRIHAREETQGAKFKV